MKKKFKIILWVLFAISIIFIGTGALLIDNNFYLKNTSENIIMVSCETKDGCLYEFTISEGDCLLIFNKKALQLNNKPKDFESMIIKLTIFGNDTTVFIEPEWIVNTEKRKNDFYFYYKSKLE